MNDVLSEDNVCYNVVIPFNGNLTSDESTTRTSHVFQHPQSQLLPASLPAIQLNDQATVTTVQSQPNLTESSLYSNIDEYQGPSSSEELVSSQHIAVTRSRSVPVCTDFEQFTGIHDNEHTCTETISDVPVHVNLHPNVAYFRTSHCRTNCDDAEIYENVCTIEAEHKDIYENLT